MKAVYLMILAAWLAVPTTGMASNVKLYRWNAGYRVESEPAFQLESSEEEFSALLKRPGEALNKNHAALFSGCYLVEKSAARSPASQTEKPALYRVCLPPAGN